jgi:hypothetical protein
MGQWQVSKPLGQCSGTGEKIEPGDEYFAALVETEQGLERRDFSVDYWEREKPEVFCYWRTRLQAEDTKGKIFVDDEMLMSFFERLETETQQEKLNLRYVLALILMRRRRLKYDSARIEDEREIWRVKIAGENRFAEVVNPGLGEEQINQLSGQLSQILQAQL